MGRDDIECGIDRRISLFGDETHWWVFNDKGNAHTESGGTGNRHGNQGAGVSRLLTDDEINKMTFFNYELINRGTQTLTGYVLFAVRRCGFGRKHLDDYAGCDVSRGLGYVYNGDLNDETQSGKIGYGENPPAIGIDFFEGPYQDPDGVDNPIDHNTVIRRCETRTDVAIAAGGIVYAGLGIGYGDNDCGQRTVRDAPICVLHRKWACGSSRS